MGSNNKPSNFNYEEIAMVNLIDILESKNRITIYRLTEEWGFVSQDKESGIRLFKDPFQSGSESKLCFLVQTDSKLAKKDNYLKNETIRVVNLQKELCVNLKCEVSIYTEKNLNQVTKEKIFNEAIPLAANNDAIISYFEDECSFKDFSFGDHSFSKENFFEKNNLQNWHQLKLNIMQTKHAMESTVFPKEELFSGLSNNSTESKVNLISQFLKQDLNIARLISKEPHLVNKAIEQLRSEMNLSPPQPRAVQT